MESISLHLRDLAGTLVEAWHTEFDDLDSVQVSQGDIFCILCPGLATSIGQMPVSRCARQMRAAWDAVLGEGLPFPDHLHQAAEFDRFLTS